MLLVDFGENTFKFALVREQKNSLEVQEWGIEEIRSLEYAAAHVLEKMGNARADIGSVLLSFPSFLWRSRVLHERIERKNPSLRIDKIEKEAILEDIFARARSSLKAWVQNSSGILAEDISVKKLQILQRTIDGYQVEDILNFPGTYLDVQILAVFALVKHLPIIDNIVQRFSGVSCHIVHYAEALEEFSQAKAQDAVYINMGDASCRIIVAQQKHTVFVDEVPRGGKDFTSYLQEVLSLGENTAKDFKERYASGDFSFPLREKVKEGFLRLAKDLAGLLCKSLAGVSVPLPPSVFLFGGTSKLPEIQEVFQGSILEKLPFREKPRVSSLLPKDLWDLPGFPGKTNPVFTPLFFLPYADKENS